MAKVRCAKCGEIFGLQQGDIQVCPVCGCRMKVNRKPQADYRAKTYEPAPSVPSAPSVPVSVPEKAVGSSDEYDALRREYMDMMREKLEKSKNGEDGVYLTRAEYDALIKNNAAADAPAYGTAAQLGHGESAAPAFEKVAAAPDPDDYASYDAPVEDAEDERPFRKKGGAKSLINWFSFLFALLAGVMSALLLVLDAQDGVKGMDLFLPGGSWSTAQSVTVMVIFFAPALFALFALVSSAIKGKISKFVLMLLYLLCGAAMLLFPFFYSLAEGATFNFDKIASSFDSLTMFGIAAVALDGAAFLVMFIAGIVTSKKRKQLDPDDELL